MDSWLEGTRIRMNATVRDALTQELVDPTTVVCLLRSPDGALVQVVPVRLSLGTYAAEYVPTAHGVWTYRFAGTGTADTAGEGAFFIRQSAVA